MATEPEVCILCVMDRVVTQNMSESCITINTLNRDSNTLLDHSLIIHEAEALRLSATLGIKTAKLPAQLRHLWLGVLAPLRQLTASGLSGLVTTSGFSVMTTLSQSNLQCPAHGYLIKKSEVSMWTHSFPQSAAAAFPVSFSGSSQRTERCQAKLLAAVV